MLELMEHDACETPGGCALGPRRRPRLRLRLRLRRRLGLLLLVRGPSHGAAGLGDVSSRMGGLVAVPRAVAIGEGDDERGVFEADVSRLGCVTWPVAKS